MKRKLRVECRPALALLLAAQLALPVGAQQAAAAKNAEPAAKPAPAGLKLAVVEGEGAQNKVKGRIGARMAVEARDAAGKPLPGVEVIFQLPATGPGGNFHGWVKSQVVRTGDDGRAATTDYNVNDQLGRFNVKVTAALGAEKDTAVIAQTNVAGGSAPGATHSRRALWITLGVAAGIAAGVGVAAGRSGSNTVTQPALKPVAIGVGAITVGAPR